MARVQDVTLLDELIAALEDAWADQPPQQVALRVKVWLHTRREHLAELKRLRKMVES